MNMAIHRYIQLIKHSRKTWYQ